jgi:D-psicose/D-tagatose/L-ribulose 3-epimerase
MELQGIDPAAIRRAADAAGVGLVTSVGLDDDHDPSSEDPASRRRAREFLEHCVEATAEMGADLFTGVNYSAMGRRPERRPDEDDRRRAAEVLREVARFAAPLGVTVGIEPVNRYETFLVNTSAQALELKRLVGEPNVGVHLDAYHMNIEEDDFYEPVAAAVGDLVHFHLSESHRGVPSRGTVDWRAIMRALAEGGYEGLVGLESFAESPRRCALPPASGVTSSPRATSSCARASPTSSGSSARSASARGRPQLVVPPEPLGPEMSRMRPRLWA